MDDGYRRGRDVDRTRRGPVNSPYRRIIPVVWLLGVVMVVVGLALDSTLDSAFLAYLISHAFLAALVRGDIRSLRRQGVEWGVSRHLWFGTAFGFPLVALGYFVYSRRVLRRANDRRTNDRRANDE